jgi:endonuclease/exonuclease/phosphatase family metal-dependent hydrolase
LFFIFEERIQSLGFEVLFHKLNNGLRSMSSCSAEKITFLTYNIDGLNDVNLKFRTEMILSLILSNAPDVVQLQEVVLATMHVISETLSKHSYVSFLSSENMSDMCHYFTLTFVKRDCSTNAICRRVQYNGNAKSQQGRDILQLTVTIKGQQWLFVNCHLESCGTAFKSPGSTIRQAQLQECLQLIATHASVGPAVLAGDLNIREPEAKHVLQSFPTGVVTDVAALVEGVSKKKLSDTWYMPGPSPYKARYDRVYCNNFKGLVPTAFETMGGESIYDSMYGSRLEQQQAEAGMPYATPSDHRGLWVAFSYHSSPTSTAAASSSSSLSYAASSISTSFVASSEVYGKQPAAGPVPSATSGAVAGAAGFSGKGNMLGSVEEGVLSCAAGNRGNSSKGSVGVFGGWSGTAGTTERPSAGRDMETLRTKRARYYMEQTTTAQPVVSVAAKGSLEVISLLSDSSDDDVERC